MSSVAQVVVLVLGPKPPEEVPALSLMPPQMVWSSVTSGEEPALDSKLPEVGLVWYPTLEAELALNSKLLEVELVWCQAQQCLSPMPLGEELVYLQI